MESGFWDDVTTELKQSMQFLRMSVREDFKGTKPYRKDPPDPKQQLLDYDSLTPQDVEFARQNYGDEVVENYIRDMEQLRGKYGK